MKYVGILLLIPVYLLSEIHHLPTVPHALIPLDEVDSVQSELDGKLIYFRRLKPVPCKDSFTPHQTLIALVRAKRSNAYQPAASPLATLTIDSQHPAYFSVSKYEDAAHLTACSKRITWFLLQDQKPKPPFLTSFKDVLRRLLYRMPKRESRS